jgi:CPA2 family monovalent cation:H+ antiporter-2
LLIAPEASSMFSAIVTLSMMTTPFLLFIARRLEFAKPDEGEGLEGPDDAPQGKAVIVGYGRFGQTVAQMLMGQGCQVTLIDKKPAQIELSSQFDIKVYYGDGTRVDLLRRAGAENANLLIFAHDDRNFSAAAMESIAEAFPHAAILARAYDRRQLIDFTRLDLAGVTRELYESAVSMGRTALGRLGLDEKEVAEVERQYRANDQQRLDLQLTSGKLTAAKDLMYRPGRMMVLPARQTVGDDA